MIRFFTYISIFRVIWVKWLPCFFCAEKRKRWHEGISRMFIKPEHFCEEFYSGSLYSYYPLCYVKGIYIYVCVCVCMYIFLWYNKMRDCRLLWQTCNNVYFEKFQILFTALGDQVKNTCLSFCFVCNTEEIYQVLQHTPITCLWEILVRMMHQVLLKESWRKLHGIFLSAAFRPIIQAIHASYRYLDS